MSVLNSFLDKRANKYYPYLQVHLVILVVSFLFVACSSGVDLDEPPEIRYGEDVCERCQMIINEARFAAAYTTTDGQAYRFDDIGGMLAHHADVGDDVAVFWVHDFDTEAWLRAEEAFFVKSDQHTPMGFGIVAFADQDRADTWADAQAGMVMTFDQLQAASAGEEHAHDEPDLDGG